MTPLICKELTLVETTCTWLEPPNENHNLGYLMLGHAIIQARDGVRAADLAVGGLGSAGEGVDLGA
jgi:hypothetical protein